MSRPGLSKSDTMLSPSSWEFVQFELCGLEGVNLDLVSLDSNTQVWHFLASLYTMPYSELFGVNVFNHELAQCIRVVTLLPYYSVVAFQGISCNTSDS